MSETRKVDAQFVSPDYVQKLVARIAELERRLAAAQAEIKEHRDRLVRHAKMDYTLRIHRAQPRTAAKGGRASEHAGRPPL